MSDLVRCNFGGQIILMTKEDVDAAENDRSLTGNMFITVDNYGHGKRLAPADVSIKMPKRGDVESVK